MNIAYIGNIPEPTGGAEVMLDRFLELFLKNPKRRATLLRWRRQYFFYVPEFVERIYAPPGTVEQRGRLKIIYLFESFLREPLERRKLFAQRLFDSYKIQAGAGAAILKKEKPNLIHVHMLFPNVFFGARIAEALDLPWVVTIHGMLEFKLLDRFDKRFPDGKWKKHFMEDLKKADCVTVVSDELVEECRRRGLKHIVKISSGVDTNFFKPNGAVKNKKDILFLGTIRQDKGAELLLKAFNRVKNQIPGKLVLIGKNVLPDDKWKPYEKDSKIRFMGIQSAKAIRRTMHQSRFMILPSASEGLPVSILEGMACETPVSVTPVGDMKDMIRDGENGFFIKERSVSGIAKSLLQLSNHVNLHTVGRKARQTAEKFSLKQVTKQYENVYHSVV